MEGFCCVIISEIIKFSMFCDLPCLSWQKKNAIKHNTMVPQHQYSMKNWSPQPNENRTTHRHSVQKTSQQNSHVLQRVERDSLKERLQTYCLLTLTHKHTHTATPPTGLLPQCFTARAEKQRCLLQPPDRFVFLIKFILSYCRDAISLLGTKGKSPSSKSFNSNIYASAGTGPQFLQLQMDGRSCDAVKISNNNKMKLEVGLFCQLESKLAIRQSFLNTNYVPYSHLM